jgi:hypothetical protein
MKILSTLFGKTPAPQYDIRAERDPDGLHTRVYFDEQGKPPSTTYTLTITTPREFAFHQRY